MNILTCINKRYLPYFTAMISSLADHNAGEHTVYIVTSEVTDDDIKPYRKYIPERVKTVTVKFDNSLIKGAPTVKRWPKEIYYRIFAAQYLPESVDRILYLDSDMIINGDLSELYERNFDGQYFIATTNIHNRLFRRFILWKNGATKKHVYANTGVLLMNLVLLRKEQRIDEVLSYIKRRKWLLSLPDQDVISTLYGLKISLVDNKVYNLSEREIRWNKRHKKANIDEKWVDENTKIIHYLSRNKPWKEGYKGILKPWYDKYKVE